MGSCYEDCCRQIEIPDEKIINVVPRGSKRNHGYDEYDSWTTYYVDVVYKD